MTAAFIHQTHPAFGFAGLMGSDETTREFDTRLSVMREWLLGRPERSVAVVAPGEVTVILIRTE